MTRITFIESDGATHEVTVSEGKSLMEGAVQQGIEGIVAECGGACACATCHCYIDEDWVEITGSAGDMEAAMLEDSIDLKPTSRLACQIVVTKEMHGMIVRLPEDQI